MVRVEIPATTANLGPAFDALGMALQLFNVVEMSETDCGLKIAVSGEGADLIERDEQNMIYQAAAEVFARVGYQPSGLMIRLENHIPVSSGLGSSAAAIIGGMVAANCLAGKPLSGPQLLEMAVAREGHPDNVAAALFGGIVVAVAADDRIEHLRFEPPVGLKAVVAIPRFAVSTEAARSILPEQVSFSDAVFNVGRTALLVASLAKGNLEGLLPGMQDRLHQNYRGSLVPGLSEVLKEVRNAGAKGVALSGAGPTLVALTAGGEAAVAKAFKDTWGRFGIAAEVLILEPDQDGARVEYDGKQVQ